MQRHTLHSEKLECELEQKDFGVILDADLKLDKHISKKIKKQTP